MRPGAVAVCVALALAACGHSARPDPRFVCPARGGPPWSELSTEHFVVTSDLRRADVVALAHELESVRGWVIAALFPRDAPVIPGRVRVVAFRTPEEFDEFAPAGLRAFFTRNGLGEAVIVFPGDLRPVLRLVLAHELTHQVARHVYPRQPRWFGEGLAGLAEAETDAAGRPVYGPLPPHRGLGFLKQHVAVRELLAWNGRSQDGRYHDTATVLVHFLVARERERFDEVRRRLARAEAPDGVFPAVFPEWAPDGGSPEALDRALLDHVHEALRGAGEKRRLEVPAGAAPVARRMSAGEVHAARLTLTRFARGDPGAGKAERAEVEEALAEDPDHVVALQVKAALDRLDPLPLARRAARAHPEEVRAWLWLAAAARGEALEAERLSALFRAVEVSPTSAMASNNLAWNLLLRGDLERALPLAERAAALSPGDPAILDTRAAVLEALGRCAEALETAERALELLPAEAPGSARDPWLERAARLRARCGARAHPEPTPAQPSGPRG